MLQASLTDLVSSIKSRNLNVWVPDVWVFFMLFSYVNIIACLYSYTKVSVNTIISNLEF